MRHATIWELQGPDEDQATLRRWLDAGQFPWERCVDGIRRQVGRDYVPIGFEDLSRFTAIHEAAHKQGHHLHTEGMHVLASRERVLGVFWTDYRVAIDASLRDEEQLGTEVTWSEGAHVIDQAVLTDSDRIRINYALHPGGLDEHPPWWERSNYSEEYHQLPGETFMEIVYELCVPGAVATMNLAHEVTPYVMSEARAILIPTPAPYFSSKRSRVFHDRHARAKRELNWWTYDAALATGRRPCGTCDPAR